MNYIDRKLKAIEDTVVEPDIKFILSRDLICWWNICKDYTCHTCGNVPHISVMEEIDGKIYMNKYCPDCNTLVMQKQIGVKDEKRT